MGIVFGDEVSRFIVHEIGLIGKVEVMGFHRICGGGKGEHVIHRCGNLEGSLVAVALYPCDPLGIDHARAHDPGNFLVKSAHNRAFRPRMIIVIGGGFLAGGGFDGGAEAPFKLIVVVGVEEIVLSVVLIVDDGFHGGEAAAERVSAKEFPRPSHHRHKTPRS